MNCDDVRGLLDAYVDGELASRDRAAVGRHVEGCEACARDVARTRALSRRLRGLARYPLPSGMQDRLAAVMAGGVEPRRWPGWPWRWPTPALVVSHAVAGLAGAIAVIAWLQTKPADQIESDQRELVSAHVRALVQDQFRAVESGNPHTVRPWFAGKIGFAPRFVDLADAGFPLQGGRIDHLLGRPAAALLYARRNHRITVFIAPSEDHSSIDGRVGGSHGYHVVGWRDTQFAYWAVSDLNPTELAKFATLLRTGIAGAGVSPPD